MSVPDRKKPVPRAKTGTMTSMRSSSSTHSIGDIFDQYQKLDGEIVNDYVSIDEKLFNFSNYDGDSDTSEDEDPLSTRLKNIRMDIDTYINSKNRDCCAKMCKSDRDKLLKLVLSINK